MKKVIICSAVSALMLLNAHGESKKIPAAEKYREYISDIRSALPEFSSFGKERGREVELLDKNGKEIAQLKLAPEKRERKEGFNGVIDTAVILKNGKICGVAVGKNSETPRWMSRVRKAGFLTRWNGKSLPEAAALEVDAVTRATYSCEAIKSEVRSISAPENHK